ncbi:MAG: alpha-1,2-fucosyltransferase [Kiritimatiellae bacterium]|nr:alpha-1,2-fucosyltransferase [Kiritimatiellia bacterium]MDD5523057.1 alpha-1,2-fucosyltransferase [Kiritimatiellia bacterium]
MTLIARLSGGLGNQLFQYAAAKRVAIHTGMTFKLDVISGFKHDSVYARKYLLDNFAITATKASRLESFDFPGSRTLRSGLRWINRYLPLGFYMEEPGFMEPNQKFDESVLAVGKHKLLFMEGNWQSEKYFKDVVSVIRKEFELVTPLDVETLREADIIRSVNAVGVGVRSYAEVPAYARHFHKPIGVEYYARAISRILKSTPDAHFFIFCDNETAAGKLIPTDIQVTYVRSRSDDKAFQKLWLMTLCKHFIISNSSFDWWGAWLSSALNKVVIAPARYTNNEDMIPADWLKIAPD